MEEQERFDLEDKYLDKIFAGTISTLRGIRELLALGIDEKEAKSLAYRARPGLVLIGGYILQFFKLFSILPGPFLNRLFRQGKIICRQNTGLNFRVVIPVGHG
jgi:hypothetical protein